MFCNIVMNISFSNNQLSPTTPHSSPELLRHIAMLAMGALFFVLSTILCILGTLSQVTLPFAGAYFMIGCFLYQVSISILILNALCVSPRFLPL